MVNFLFNVNIKRYTLFAGGLSLSVVFFVLIVLLTGSISPGVSTTLDVPPHSETNLLPSSNSKSSYDHGLSTDSVRPSSQLRESPAYNPTVIWEYSPPKTIDLWTNYSYAGITLDPALGDVNADGRLELICVCEGGDIIALDAQDGLPLWNYSIDGTGSAPALGNLDADPMLELVVTDTATTYVLHAENGTLLWSVPISGNGMPTLVDINHDSRQDLLLCSKNIFYALNGENGALLWSFHRNKPKMDFQSPVVADIDSDNQIEVILMEGGIQGAEYLHALNAEDGSTLWNYSIAEYGSVPCLADVDGDKKLEVLFFSGIPGIEMTLCALNAEDGSVLWEEPLDGAEHNTLAALADIDNNRRLELIVGTCDNVRVFNADNGSHCMAFPFGYEVSDTCGGYTYPALGDLDGDNKLELLWSSGERLYIFDAETGEYQWEHQLAYWNDTIARGGITTAPLLVDLDNDSELEVIIGTEGSSGKVFALDLGATGKRLYWQGFRGTFQSTQIRRLFDIDQDMDFLSDYSEPLYGTDVSNNDTDADGMWDGWEVTNTLDPLVNDTILDPDADGLTNWQEYQSYTDPRSNDTDNDGLGDGQELEINTDPLKTDTDGDELPDGWEVRYGLDATSDDKLDDPDGDGLLNLYEFRNSTHPQNADTDADGLPDGWEVENGLNPTSANANEDPDSDGLTNLEEYLVGTHPNKNDTDGDGALDGEEVGWLVDPFNPSDNPLTRLLILLGMESSVILGGFITFYVSRRQEINQRLKSNLTAIYQRLKRWWLRLTSRTPPSEGTLLTYAKKAQDYVVKKERKESD
ncbi:MAG: PQQ-binding-like beta-propeller repeat protein [Promethearchaeota archaeon]